MKLKRTKLRIINRRNEGNKARMKPQTKAKKKEGNKRHNETTDKSKNERS